MSLSSDSTSLAAAAAAAAAALLIAVAFLANKLWLLLGATKRKRTKHSGRPPVGGTVLHHLLNFRRLHHFAAGLARRYKTYRVLAPFRTEVYTADPANVEYILKTNFSNYGKGEYNYCNMKDLLGDGIFAIDGSKWRHQRKVTSLEFSTRMLRDYSSAVFRSKAANLASFISEAARCNNVVDIQDLFMKLTMDSTFHVAFGVELDSLHESNTEGSKFAAAFDDSSALITWRYVDISWKIKKFLNIGCEAELKKKLKVVDGFIYKIIQNKIEEATLNQKDAFKKADILSRFLVEREKDPENITTQYLRDIMLSLLVAGKDTTAVTLSWFIYMLCKHPSIEEKVVREVISATKGTGDDASSIDEFAAGLNEEVIERMHYLHATLTETLRLYPAVPMDPKVCFSDDILPDGYNVRKGDVVAYMPFAMGRMEYLWGNDVKDFRPERWLNEEGVFSPESPFKFTAFQAGPRVCLGKDFAYRQMKIVAAVLLRFFKFKLRDEKNPVKYRTMLTLQIDKGLHVLPVHR